MRAVETSALLG